MDLHLHNKLWHFHGGLHPEQHKEASRDEVIRNIPLPERLILPLQQHIGAEAEIGVITAREFLEKTGQAQSGIYTGNNDRRRS